MKVYAIVPEKLYQSARTHPLLLPEKLALAQRYRIDVVVNLWHTADEEMQALVGEYIHRPMPDGKTIEDGALHLLAAEVGRKILEGKRVLIHCYGGRNRAGLLSALIVRWLEGMSGQAALELVWRQRPNSLVNEHFCNYLRGLL